MKNLKKIKGDASSRKFFRKKDKKITSIIVYTQKDKFKNLLAYDAVNKIFIKKFINCVINKKILEFLFFCEN